MPFFRGSIRAVRSKSVPIGQIHPQKIRPKITVIITSTIELRSAVFIKVPERIIPSAIRGSKLKKRLCVRLSWRGKDTRRKIIVKRRKKKA